MTKATLEPSTIKTIDVPLAHIVFGPNVRKDISKGLDEFAAGMDAAGQLQPVKLLRIDGCSDSPMPKWMGKLPDTAALYVPAFGHRRIEAARKLGWDCINAEIVDRWSEADRRQWQAAENLQREDLTAVEESLAVAQMIDACGKEDPIDQVRVVAERLGRSEPWVRDRVYVARLGGEARDLLADGLLSLGQAREIAKLADPGLRDEVAQYAARDEFGQFGWSIDKVRSWVASHMHALKVVPWKMDAKVGELPACATCPSNSVNDPGLFEHDEEQPAECGVCLNPACFAMKQKQVDKEVEKLETKAKAGKEVAAPEFVKETTFKRRIDKATGKGPAAKTGKLPGTAKGEAPWEIESRGRNKHMDACDEWLKGSFKALRELDNPLALIACLAFNGQYQGSYNIDDRVLSTKEGKAFMDLARAAKADPDGGGDFLAKLRALAAHVKLDDLDTLNECSGVTQQLLGCMGVTTPPLPHDQDWYIEQEKNKAAEKARPAEAKPPAKGDAKKPAGARHKKKAGGGKKAGSGGGKKVRR